MLKCKRCFAEIIKFLTPLSFVFKQYSVPKSLSRMMIQKILQYCDVFDLHYLCLVCQSIDNLRVNEALDHEFVHLRYTNVTPPNVYPKRLLNTEIRPNYCDVCLGNICEECGKNSFFLCQDCYRGYCSDHFAWTWCQCGRECICKGCADKNWTIECSYCKFTVENITEFHENIVKPSNGGVACGDAGYMCSSCGQHNGIGCNKKRKF